MRLTTTGSHRWRDVQGQEQSLRQFVQQRLKRRGQRFKARSHLFKEADWRPVQMVGYWGERAKESLVLQPQLFKVWRLSASSEIMATHGKSLFVASVYRPM